MSARSEAIFRFRFYGRCHVPAEVAFVSLGEWWADPDGPRTQFYLGTKSSCTASGLNPGQIYYFQVRAVGPLGPGSWSDIAQKRAS